MLLDSPQFTDGPFCTTEGKNREGTWERAGNAEDIQELEQLWGSNPV